jgi:hypothetical protein
MSNLCAVSGQNIVKKDKSMLLFFLRAILVCPWSIQIETSFPIFAITGKFLKEMMVFSDGQDKTLP